MHITGIVQEGNGRRCGDILVLCLPIALAAMISPDSFGKPSSVIVVSQTVQQSDRAR
jgi:hypothetical protein